MENNEILDSVSRYYTGKLAANGATPQGVDWNSEASQNLRFEQLLKIVADDAAGTLLDYGCGYAALRDHLQATHARLDYTGFDIATAMLDEARKRKPELPAGALLHDPAALGSYDYVVASGIFNVRLDTPVEAWEQYVLDTIRTLARHTRKGFAFNVLTSYSDPEYMRGDLYYADPCFYFDHCKRHYSKSVALLHDYGLYEFTLLVRKAEEDTWLSS